MKLPDGVLVKDFKKVRTRDQVIDALCQFVEPHAHQLREVLLERLKIMRQKIHESPFFRKHEVIGSSLLFVYDKVHAGVWMIDFAKSMPVDESITLDHRTPWQLGNHEDGYLFGLDNLIQVLEDTALRNLSTIDDGSKSRIEQPLQRVVAT